ncbi:unnamed protein product [Phytophthora fragariaefolia]|uniref:Unnamed protein product n=1 Tax=Phytophthora fragariaefolia TaxID=1490495 RepID=A0A9W7D872_9STRA|nr:unnamed protein product [Phytophthora fragariaefolia]
MTVVQTIRDDKSEFEDYPSEHFYAAQENAWMDKNVWKIYVEKLLKFEIDALTVLLLDNFDCNASEKRQALVAEQANATVVPLPPNGTAVCQPLDVGVMGPLKAKLRNSTKSTGGTAKDDRLRAISAAISALNSVTPQAVIRSFEKAISRYPELTI